MGHLARMQTTTLGRHAILLRERCVTNRITSVRDKRYTQIILYFQKTSYVCAAHIGMCSPLGYGKPQLCFLSCFGVRGEKETLAILVWLGFGYFTGNVVFSYQRWQICYPFHLPILCGKVIYKPCTNFRDLKIEY